MTRVTASVSLAVLLVVLFASAANAHTAFESSDPAPGAIVDAPIDRIVITFTGEATEAGEGFVVLRPDGHVVDPPVTRSDDGREFTLLIEPPLTGGEVGVRWTVRAGDAHPIDGSFSFTTTAPTPTPTVAPTASPAPTVAPTVPVEPAATTLPEPTMEPAPTPAALEADADESDLVPPPARIDDDSVETTRADIAAPTTLQEFLAGDDGFDAGRPLGWVARPLSVIAAVSLLGLVAFHVFTLRRPIGEVDGLAPIVLAAAVMLAVGAVVEGVSLGIGDLGLGSSTTAAVALRLSGALVVIGAVRRATTSRLDPLVAVGGLAILVSWAFDGHTVSEGNRLLTTAADLVHVGGASVWAGGIVGLLVLAQRQPDRLAGWAVRFSVVATAALAVVAGAGVVLTVTILEAFDDLWTTDWGRVLIAKVAFVAVAVAAGAWNHFVVVPGLESPEPARAERMRAQLGRTLRIEATALGAAALLTGGLIAAATV